MKRAFERIRQVAVEEGFSVLVVEQKVREILSVADRVYVLRGGRVSYSGVASELQDDDAKLRAAYL